MTFFPMVSSVTENSERESNIQYIYIIYNILQNVIRGSKSQKYLNNWKVNLKFSVYVLFFLSCQAMILSALKMLSRKIIPQQTK